MDNNITISLCMIVKNEEQNIARCLGSVKEAVDEIIVIDTGSTDKTMKIARAYGAKVQSFLWNGNFSDARNASLDLAAGGWILFLDADESMTAGSGAVLREIVKANDVEGYFIKIINYVGSESYSECSPDMVFRLFRNRPDYRFHDAVHEQIVDTIQARSHQAKFLIAEEVVILHYGYLNQQIEEKDKINRNLSMLSKELAVHPDSLSLRYHYGVELYRSGQFEASVGEFLAVIQQLEPGALYLARVIRYIVMAYHGAGRLEEAMDMVNTGIAQVPDYADLYYYGGLISYDTKNYGAAYA
ncbi:MAG: glycosyltransferase, partial [Veillonellales bacterium]